jgi:hypothetical protein
MSWDVGRRRDVIGETRRRRRGLGCERRENERTRDEEATRRGLDTGGEESIFPAPHIDLSKHACMAATFWTLASTYHHYYYYYSRTLMILLCPAT